MHNIKPIVAGNRYNVGDIVYIDYNAKTYAFEIIHLKPDRTLSENHGDVKMLTQEEFKLIKQRQNANPGSINAKKLGCCCNEKINNYGVGDLSFIKNAAKFTVNSNCQMHSLSWLRHNNNKLIVEYVNHS